MGTTSQKLTYLNDTKQLLKQKINNLGGDITSETTFRQYADKLQTIYDNAPKTDYAEGSNITLSNTLKGKLDFEDGIVGYGDTEQDTTQGINMLDLSNFSTETTINSVKFTPVENGGIKINGTATANAILEFAFSLVLNGNYTMATKLDGTFTNNESPQVILRSSNTTVIYNSGMEQNAIKINTFNNINSTIDKVRIVAVNGSTYNCIIYPMCLSGTYNTVDSLPDFEKFTGNSPSPSPSYPQDIEVVRGKNRFDKNSVTTGYYYNLNGTLMASNNWNVEQVEVQPNTNYYLSGNNYNNEIAGIVLLDKDKNFISLVSSYKNVHLITTTATTKYIGLSIANYSDNSDMNTMQLEKRKCSYFLSTL